jgi:hypothetical protein
MTRRRSSSRVVRETATAAASWRASSERRSRSLVTRWLLGNYDDRVAKLCEDLEAAARDTELSLDGLVGVCDAAHGEHLRLPAGG